MCAMVTSANAVTIAATSADDHEIKLLLSSGSIRRICAAIAGINNLLPVGVCTENPIGLMT